MNDPGEAAGRRPDAGRSRGFAARASERPVLRRLCAAYDCTPRFLLVLWVVMALTTGLVLLKPGLALGVWKVVDELISEDSYVTFFTRIVDKPGEIGIALIHVDDAAHPLEDRPAPVRRDLLLDILEHVDEYATAVVLDLDLGEIEAELPDVRGRRLPFPVVPEGVSLYEAEAAAYCGAAFRRRPGRAEVEDTPEQALARALFCRGRGEERAPPLVLVEPTPRPEGERWLDRQPHVLLGHAQIPLDPDSVVREWRLTAAPGPSDTAVCSVVLLAALAHLRGAGEAEAIAFRKALAERGVLRDEGWPPRCRPLEDDEATAPIAYAAAWPWLRPTLPGEPRIAPPTRIDEAFVRSTALQLDDLGPKALSGRVVAIGATHSEISDRLLTPMGEMPGVLVIANAINGAPGALEDDGAIVVVVASAAVLAVALVTLGLVLRAAFALPAGLLLVFAAGWLTAWTQGPVFVYHLAAFTALLGLLMRFLFSLKAFFR
jgi:CHASE2 domain-containing sensor protein